MTRIALDVPFGSTNAWPVFVDERLAELMISIGGGAPGVSITIGGNDLLRVLVSTSADLTKQRDQQ